MSIIPVMRASLSSRGRGKGLFSPGAATKLGFTAQPQAVTVNATMTAVVVAIQDANGNTVTNSNATVAIALTTGGGILNGTLSKSATNGVASFSDLSIDTAGLGDRLTATSTGLTQVVSNTFDVTAAGATPWLLEDFSTYTSTTHLKTNPNGYYATFNPIYEGNWNYNVGQIFLDTGVGVNVDGYSLTKSMRYDFPASAAEEYTLGVDMFFPGSVLGGPYTTIDEVWIEIYVLFQNGFTTNGSGAQNPDYKMFFIANQTSSRANLQPGTFGNSWTWGIAPDQQGNGGSPTGTIFGTPFDGLWHQYRVHLMVDRSGAAGHYTAGDWWMDGTLQKAFPGVTVAKSTYGPFWILALGRNQNQGITQAQSLWWGRIAIYNTDPGWGIA